MEAPGIKEIYLSDGAADFPATPVLGTNVFALGHIDSGTLDITPYNEIKTKRGMVFSSCRNFKADMATLEMGYALLKFLFGAAKVSDITAKIITSGITKTTDFVATGGIYSFTNTFSMGVDFELSLTPQERMLKVILERAYKESVATTIITNSKTDTLKGTLNIPALDPDNLVMDYINPPFGSVTILDERLNDWKISLKTKNTKNKFNRSIISRIEVDMFGAMDGVTPDEMNTFHAGAICPDLTIPIGVDTPYNIILKSGGLTQNGDTKFDDEKRVSTVHFQGSYDIDFVDLTTGSNITLQAKL